MKYFLRFFILFSILTATYLSGFSQNNVGIGTTTPDANAILELQSTSKGFLIPRMPAANRIAMTPSLGTAQTGLLVFDNDSVKFFYWNGFTWQTFGTGGLGPAGPAGPTGAQGLAGAIGPAGPTGAASTIPGPIGPSGPAGITGPTGAASTVPGPAGPAGSTGPAGITGPTGTASTIPGPTGPTGLPGTPGTPGTQGPTGPQGITGPTGSGSSCLSLDQAYDGCSGSGSGRNITADAGRVEITLPLAGTNSEAMRINTNKGTQAVPTAGIDLLHTQHGAAIYAENSNTANLYGVIQASCLSSNTNTSQFPSALSGYFDGTGHGVGVWGEVSSGTTGGGAGLYGMASNNNFGATLFSNIYPGLNCWTNSPSSQSGQIASSGASYTNPAFLSVGRSQFDCSSNATSHSIIINNISTEPTIAASASQYGYVGTNAYPWYYVYAQSCISLSIKSMKRSINYLDNSMYELAMSDIDAIKPAFYKFKNETDEFVSGKESKYRPNMHLGLILDEAPDYLQDNTFSGIDVYALSTLAITGVKYNREKIKQIENNVNDINKLQTISEFGTASFQGNPLRVNYPANYVSSLHGNIPVVTVTPLSQSAGLYIVSQDASGFTVAGPQNISVQFNWIAVSRTETPLLGQTPVNTDISQQLLEQIRVPEGKKLLLKNFTAGNKMEIMTLKGENPALNYKPLRFSSKNEK